MIVINNVSKNFDDINAAENISMHIKKGEKIGIVGANGAGKTTLIRMICGLLKQDDGDIRVIGHNPLQHNKNVGRKIGVVYGIGGILAGKGKMSFGFDAIQAFASSGNLRSDITVSDNFKLIRLMYKIPKDVFKERMDKLHETLEIKNYLKSYVNELSLGQKMRAELASVLIYEPELLILDEPFIGIDIEAKEKIRSYLETLSDKNNTTIILTTHNVEEIEKICNRVAVIDKGKIIFNGGIDKINLTYGKINSMEIEFGENIPDLQDLPFARYVIHNKRMKIYYDNSRITSKEILQFLSSKYEIKDLLIKKPEIEDIIKQIYYENLDYSDKLLQIGG
ncbi:MAG: ATP-binding cassette domain-containing protein [Lachnospiraceae bacterium]|nr:ATP-binding cassette domain-containing protein [Lachnospiraceae bacterium]